MTVKESILELEALRDSRGVVLTMNQVQAIGLSVVVLKAMPEKEVELVDMVMTWKAQDTR